MKFIRKYIRIIMPLALLIALLVTGVSLASLRAETQNLTNNFVVGEVTTKIEEDLEVSDGTIKKAPRVVNEGPNDCLVRMRVTISPREIADYLEVNGSIDYDETNWEYNTTDGFWYYKKILPYEEGGEDNKTTALFSTIKGLVNQDGKIVEQFRDVEDFQITLYQEAVQAEVYDEAGKSLKAYGEDGIYNAENANKIWALYDAGEVMTSEK